MPGEKRDPSELGREPPLEPSAFFDMADRAMEGVFALASIHAAIETGLFEACEDGCTGEEFSRQSGCDPAMAVRLCQALESIGLLSQRDGTFRNTRIASVYLMKDSPFAQVEYVRKLVRHLTDYWVPLPVLMKNGPVSYRSDEFFGKLSLPAMAENAVCGRLQATIREIVRQPGAGRFRKMIDLGGGHGLYAIAAASAIPGLEAYVFDLPYVTTIAEEYIRRYGMEGRVRTMPGNFFQDDIGSGYDLVFSSSNPSGKSTEMIGRIAAALLPGGLFVNEQATGGGEKNPFAELEWLLWTLDSEKKGGITYTKERPFLTPEYRAALKAHRLEIVSETRIPDNYHTGHVVDLVIAKKV